MQTNGVNKMLVGLVFILIAVTGLTAWHFTTPSAAQMGPAGPEMRQPMPTMPMPMMPVSVTATKDFVYVATDGMLLQFSAKKLNFIKKTDFRKQLPSMPPMMMRPGGAGMMGGGGMTPP